MKEIVSKIDSMWIAVASIMFAYNFGLQMLHGFLGAIKDFTTNKIDNKIWKIVGKLVGASQKGIDLAIANKEHKKNG